MLKETVTHGMATSWPPRACTSDVCTWHVGSQRASAAAEAATRSEVCSCLSPNKLHHELKCLHWTSNPEGRDDTHWPLTSERHSTRVRLLDTVRACSAVHRQMVKKFVSLTNHLTRT